MAREQRGPGHSEREADLSPTTNGVDPGGELLSSFVTYRNEVLRDFESNESFVEALCSRTKSQSSPVIHRQVNVHHRAGADRIPSERHLILSGETQRP